jgi:hypothetical protein
VVEAAADRENPVPDTYRMIRDERFKLVYDRISGEARLFDLDADPGEHTDVRAAHADAAARLLEALGTDAQPETAAGEAPLPAEEEARLRRLGYVE